MNDEQVKARMQQLMAPVDEAIMNCDNVQDTLMLASIMMTTARNIFETTFGKQQAQTLFEEMMQK